MNARSLVLFFLILASCSSSLFAVQDDLFHVIQRGVLRVGVKDHAPPFSVADKTGRLGGFDVAIGQAISSYLEVRMEVVPLQSKDRIPFLNEDKVDIVVATMTTTRSREEEVDFSIPYFQDGQSLLCLQDSEIQSYQDLSGQKVGAVMGTTSMKNMTQVQPLAEMVGYASAKDALAALESGEIVAFTSDMLMLMGLMLENKELSLELRGGRFTVEPYGVAIRSNQSNLRDKVNDAIMALWKSGTWKAMYEKWFGPKSDYAHDNAFEVPVIN
jgi:polar amino acid transport system substrate-binding protein